MDKLASHSGAGHDTAVRMRASDAPDTRSDGDSGSLSLAISSDRHRFAAKVRAGRAILGWSQTELGRRAGLSQRSIYRLEMAAVDIRRSTVVALETVFASAGIDFEPLAGGGFKVVVAPNGTQQQ
jgi:ribosome-binding protein aMBF1 (putative translation factor)